ncbi:hypothetical protein HanIR_Chr01g0006601 [Helianthus annuus]|nr:hypothetical protein HanIR_Chr01g0006601 [Helianthus annuus]
MHNLSISSSCWLFLHINLLIFTNLNTDVLPQSPCTFYNQVLLRPCVVVWVNNAHPWAFSAMWQSSQQGASLGVFTKGA